jgi:hypothetical protein
VAKNWVNIFGGYHSVDTSFQVIKAHTKLWHKSKITLTALLPSQLVTYYYSNYASPEFNKV